MIDPLSEEYKILRYNRDEILDALLYESNPKNIFDNSIIKLFSEIKVTEKNIHDVFDTENDVMEEKISHLEDIITKQIISLQSHNTKKELDTKQLLEDILSIKNDDFASQLNIYNDTIQKSELNNNNSNKVINIIDNRKNINSDINRDFLWDHWSGNKPVPNLDLFNFIKPDAINCKGQIIQIPFKPIHWQKISDKTNEIFYNNNSSNINSTEVNNYNNYNNNHHEDNTMNDKLFYQNLSFKDFMTTIPFFQIINFEKLISLEKEIRDEVYYQDQKILSLGNSFGDVFIIRYGTVEVSRSSLANPLIQETVQFLKSGDLFGFNIKFSEESSNYNFSCFSEEVEVFVVPSKLLSSILFDKTIDNNLFPYIYGECRVRSNNYYYSNADIQFASSVMTFNSILTGKRQYLDMNMINTEVRGTSLKSMKEEKMRFTRVKRFSVLVNIMNCEYDFEDIVDEIIYQSKQLLQVDRVGLYIIDKTLNTMVLYASQNIVKTAGESKKHTPIRMPLKGVAAHVAMSNRVLNINDAYTNKHFDPSMDLRSGYRTRQMLCIPITDRLGNVISILQFINPLDKSVFTSADVDLAVCIADLISSKSYSIKIKASLNNYKYSNKITDELKFTINSVIINKNHNHVKMIVSLYVGTKQCGNTISTDFYSTEEVIDDSKKTIKRCSINFGVLFKSILISSLPQQAQICFELFSKNNHPIGYGTCNVFDFNHVLMTGTVNINLWDGSLQSMDNRYITNELESQQSNVGYELMTVNKEHSVLSITFPSFNNVIIAPSNDVPSRFYSLLFNKNKVVLNNDSLSGIGNIEWFVNNMTSSEKRKYFNLLNSFANEFLTVPKLDVEACKLILRVKNALCNDNPLYIPLVVLCTDWLREADVKEIYSSMYNWKTPAPSDILQLLDYRHQDSKVRAYAVCVIKQCSDEALLNILYQLVYLLRFESYRDSSLATLLIRRSIINPYSIGKYFLYYLYSAYHSNQSQLTHYLLIANTLLRCIPNEVKTRLLHGMFVLRRIIYNIDRVNQTTASPSKMSSKNQTDKPAKTNMLAELIRNENLPKEFCLPLRESSDIVYTGIDSFFAINKDTKTTGISFSSKISNTVSTVLHTIDSDYRLEILFCQLCKSFDFIWNEESLDLVSCNYESFLVDSNRCYFSDFQTDSQSLNNIFYKSVQAHSKSNKASVTVTRKISDDMIIKQLGLDKENDIEKSFIIDNFIRSLASYLVVSYVMGIFGVSMSNSFLKSDGSILLKSPDYILGLQNSSIGKKKIFARNKDCLFFLPCFAKVIGDKDSETYKYFIEIVSASYLSIRKKSPFILSSLLYITSQIGLSLEDQKTCIEVIRDNLELRTTSPDDFALEKLLQSINQGLKFDYQISVVY